MKNKENTETARLAVPMSQDQLRKLKAVAAMEGKTAGEWARKKLEHAVSEGLGGLHALFSDNAQTGVDEAGAEEEDDREDV